MAAAAQSSFYTEVLRNVFSFEDLLKWDHVPAIPIIMGINEIRVVAFVFSSIEVDLLSEISWGSPLHLPSGIYEPGPVTLLDLAVLFGHIDLAALLAKQGVPLSIDVASLKHFSELKVEYQHMDDYIDQKHALAAAIVAGGFMEQASVAVDWLGDGWQGEELMYRAIFFSRAEVASELKECGAKVPSARDLFAQMWRMWQADVCEQKLWAKLWHVAACGGVDLKSGFSSGISVFFEDAKEVLHDSVLDAQLSGLQSICMSLLDVMLLAGFSGVAWELLKANVWTMAGMDTFLQASSFTHMLVDTFCPEFPCLHASLVIELPLAPSCVETISQLLQLATSSAGQQYGVPLLQMLSLRQGLVGHVLDFLVIFPSELRVLASTASNATLPQSRQVDAVPSNTRPAEAVEVLEADSDGNQTSSAQSPQADLVSASSTRPAETGEVLEGGSHGSHSSAAEVKKALGADAEDKEQLDAVIKRSREDIQELSGDNVVLLRLTRCSQTPETLKVLQTSPQLAHCRSRVQEAGCEFAPTWAGGAKFFVPVTREQFDELAGTGFQIEKHHVLALREDKAIIEEALDMELRGKKRVKVRPEHGWLVEEVNYSTDSEMGFPMWPGTGSSGSAAMHIDT